MVLRCRFPLPERRVHDISYEHPGVLTGSGRGQLQQQPCPGLTVPFAGMPETVIPYLVEAFGQYMKEETP